MVRALDVGAGRWQRFQTRLLGYLIALSCLSSIVAGAIYYSRQVKFVEAEQQTRGRTLISNLAGQSELGAYSGDAAFLAAPARRAFLETDVSFVTIYGAKGEPLIHLVKPDVKVEVHLPRDLLAALLRDPSGRPTVRSAAEHDDLLAPIVTVQGDAEEGLFGSAGSGLGSSAIGVARLGLSRRPAQAKLDEVLRWGIYLGLVVLAMGALLALVLARRISQPILALARGADEVRRGNLGYQLPLRRKDELGLLAESFNRMSSKLRETVESLAHLNRNLEAEVARRTEALRRSRDFIALLNAPLLLSKLLDTALEALVRQTDSLAGALFLRQAGDTYELVVTHGALASAFAPHDVPSFIHAAAQARRPQLFEALPQTYPLVRELPAAKLLLCGPVRFRDSLEALLVLALADRPSEEQVDFVDHASSQLAIAVANARAYTAAETLAKQLEQRNVALRQQRDQLQELNRLKSEFVANISHELRTPLNAIIGYTELVNEGVYGAVTPEQAQSLGGILENAGDLLQLINQILDLSKVEVGKMAVALQDIDLNQLVRDTVESAAPLAKDRPYAITLELGADPVGVRTDPTKVRQILLNLVGNAIKFTPEGSITVSLTETEGDVHVRVRDTGIGIRPEYLKVIFDQFRQVDGSSTRKHGGTGLGLAISKKLAALLGGDILVDSTPGQGSTFTLVLPSAARRLSAGEPPELPVTIGESDVRGS
jgi:signal transduction histidine kinase/HAMP domain-containing protein